MEINEPLRITYKEAILYAALLQAIIGLLLGLIPLIVGIFRKKAKLGVLGLVASTVGGAILGLFLSVPAVGLFLWLILKKPEKIEPQQVVVNENSIDVNVKNPDNI